MASKTEESIEDDSAEVQTKACRDCKQPKLIEEYHPSRITRDGYSKDCKICEFRKAHGDTKTPTDTKRCWDCKETKYVTEFNKDKSRKDGLNNQCRACFAKYRVDNKKRIQKRQKAWRAKPENKRRKAETIAKWNSEHRAELNQNRKDRLKDNPLLRKQNRLRIRLSKALKREVELQKRERNDKNYKRNKVGGQKLKDKLELEQILGCTIAEHKEHIESTWTKEMTWDNYGKGKGQWSIDHPIPVDANWTLNNYKICFWYKNTQAMWQKDNISKFNKYDEEKKQNLIARYYARHTNPV